MEKEKKEGVQCQPCRGTGRKWVIDRDKYEQCPHCHGTGEVLHLSQSEIGKAHHFFHFT